MNRLVRWIPLFIALCGATAARAQGLAAIQNHCFQGGTHAVTSGLSSTNFQQGIIPSCTVTVYLTGTQTKATIFSNISGTPLANPFTANATSSTDPGGWIFWSVVNTGYDVVMSGGIAPNAYASPVTLTDVYPSFQFSGSGGGGFPPVQEVVAGDGAGGGDPMPEKPTTAVSGQAFVVSDEDVSNGRFDCRNPVYAGGCLGPTPQAAMQAFSDRLICYQAMTNKGAITYFPAGFIPVGTVAQPTLELPAGATYIGRGGYGSATPGSTYFTTTYNNHLTMEIKSGLTSTSPCSDGVVHTSNLYGGSGTGFGEVGCSVGGCVNYPGDTGTYPNGGPHQAGIRIADTGGSYGKGNGGIYATNNGDSGVIIDVPTVDTHTFEIGGANNMAWYKFGINQPGQVYNPNADGWHCNVMYNTVDGMFEGPTETYGWLQTPNASYMHICGTYMQGGDSTLSNVFSNRDEIGLVRAVNSNGKIQNVRIDASLGEGILITGSGNGFSNIENSTSCSGFSSISHGKIFGPYIASLGSGMTPGTYTIPAVNGPADPVGAGGTLSLVVDSTGKASTVTVSNAGTALYGQTPSFPVSAGVVGGSNPAVIGATVYTHCSKLDDETGSNSFSIARNVYEGIFGPDYSTGDLWLPAQGDTFDRGSVGTIERIEIPGVADNARGEFAHKDLPDIFRRGGGATVTGPAVSFLKGNHFISGDTSPTSWTGPFTVENIMQDLWIYGGNPNTTLPVASGWQTCTNYDLNLGDPRWYHFVVLQDDAGSTIGTNFIFKEQCDSIDRRTWAVDWDAYPSNLPALEQQGTLDVIGSVAIHSVPAALTFSGSQAGGTPGANGIASSQLYVYVVWLGGGKMVSPLSGGFICLPLPGFINNPCFQNVAMFLPEGWTRYQLYRNVSSDGTATAGLIEDVTAAGNKAQSARTVYWEDTRVAPINSTVIPSAWYSANITGTVSDTGTTIPPSSSFPGVPGQTEIDYVNGILWYATAEDTWKPWFLESNSADGEVPAGVIDGTNVTFTLANTPNPASSLHLYRNGLRLASPADYTISGNTITYQNPPSPGDTHVADYSF